MDAGFRRLRTYLELAWSHSGSHAFSCGKLVCAYLFSSNAVGHLAKIKSHPRSRSVTAMETHSSSSKIPAPVTTSDSSEIQPAATLIFPANEVETGGLRPELDNLQAPLTRIVPFADPFGGFGGHCFLHFCQFVEMLSGWIRPAPSPENAAAESLLSASRHSPLKQWGACSLGTICSTVSAAALIPLFSASSLKSFLPLSFLLIIVLVAFRFGRAAGVLGTVAAAFLFAYYLFEPEGLAVSDPVARAHLIWMVVIGVVISDLLARFRVHRMHSHKL